jgi:hypothetical protein
MVKEKKLNLFFNFRVKKYTYFLKPMNNAALNDCLAILVNGLEQNDEYKIEALKSCLERLDDEDEDKINTLKSCIARLEVQIESLQTAKYNPDKYGFPYTTDEQFDIMISHYQHDLERSRITLLEYSSKSLIFSKRLCERLMENAISHRDVIEEMMEMSLINENEYNVQSKKLMNHYNSLKEIIAMYKMVHKFP